MVQLEDLWDLYTHPACQNIRSLKEVIDETPNNVKHFYDRWLEIENKVQQEYKAPSLSAWILYEYQFRGKSFSELGKELDVTTNALCRLVKNMGIPLKSMSEVKKGYTASKEARRKLSKSLNGRRLSKEHRRKISISKRGGNNHMWNGGTSSKKYSPEFFFVMRDYIKERDSHTCQACGKGKDENEMALPVHHIDYHKDNNEEENLITLCTTYHNLTSKVNKDRETWTEMYKEKITQIYEAMGGKDYEHLQWMRADLEKRLPTGRVGGNEVRDAAG